MREKEGLQTLFLLQRRLHPESRRAYEQEFAVTDGSLHVQFVDPSVSFRDFRRRDHLLVQLIQLLLVGREIRLRRITEPTTEQKYLLHQLGLSLPER
jgi:hypothetical protein